MSIATSLDKLSETLTNCKTNLKEKGVEADNIKISDVDEKIAEIQAGGGGLNFNSVQFGNIDGFSACKLIIVDNKTFKISVTPEHDTQLYLVNSGSYNKALNKVSGSAYETDEMEIDTFMAQIMGTYGLVHSSPSYDLMEDNRQSPSVMISFELPE